MTSRRGDRSTASISSLSPSTWTGLSRRETPVTRAGGRWVRRWARGIRDARERGSISLLTLGLVLVAGMLVVVGVDITAVQLARTQLWDAADAAALDASDQVDEATLMAAGLHEQVPLTDGGVSEAASRHLRDERRPHLVTSWWLGPGTGSPDGSTAVVTVTGHVRLPMVGAVVEAFGGGVDVTVTSRARARVR